LSASLSFIFADFFISAIEPYDDESKTSGRMLSTTALAFVLDICSLYAEEDHFVVVVVEEDSSISGPLLS
jgi:hypothetical protein